MQTFGFLLFLGVIALVVWIIRVVPRAREWIAKCDSATNAPFPVWAPPAGMRPLGVPFPSFDGVDWTALSTEVDAEGVHVFDYDAVSQRGVRGKHRNPSTVAVFAIKHAKSYVETRDENDLLLAARQIDHLARVAEPVTIGGRSGVLWLADFEVGYQYNVKPPWKSAYFQIYAVNAVLWGYALTGNPLYLDTARRGLVPLGHAVGDGGFCYRTPGEGLFFEEVVSSPLHHILNGHLHTLIGLHDLRSFTGWHEVEPIIDAGVAGTVEMLPLYDRHDYSLYSLAPNPGLRNHFNIANPYYHRAHVALLRRLRSLTGEVMFETFADRWDTRCGAAFDTAWSFLLIMFRDAMKFLKSLRR